MVVVLTVIVDALCFGALLWMLRDQWRKSDRAAPLVVLVLGVLAVGAMLAEAVARLVGA